ncbi:helix-turn-helix transcriptional regulator [Halomonas maura]|uniref:helix-turn-helix transcriptional regulator n=1 Tax=Halomonas maura TaxID=117606 RepID=UPI00338EDFAB
MSAKFFLRKQDVIERCAISPSTLHRQIQAGQFPAPVQLGPRSVAWYEDEIECWITAKMQERDQLAVVI